MEEKCAVCNQEIVEEEDRKFSEDPANHPGILGPVHPKCYQKTCEKDPQLPWEDPIGGEVDYQGMAEDLGIFPGTEDDLYDEWEESDGYY